MVTFNAFLVYSPEAEIEHLAKNAVIGKEIDWKPAIILSATYLEKFGIEKLLRHFEGKAIQPKSILQRNLQLPEVALLLYGLGLIPEKHYTNMTQISSARRDAVHMVGKTSKNYLGEEANKIYGKMIQDTLEIIASLKAKQEKG
jgi:hypothetical protein